MPLSCDGRKLAVALLLSFSFAGAAPRSAGVSPVHQAPPLVFEPNQGQTSADVRFLSRGGNHALYLRANEATLVLGSKQGPAESLRMRLQGANAQAVLHPEARLEGHSNYLLGSDRSKWHTGIPHFAKVRYTSIYPGIDLIYYGKEGHLEYDFVVSPGADPSRIRFKIDGARHVKLSPEGDLVLALSSGETRHRKPLVYQDLADGRAIVDGQYSVRGNEVSFEIAEYDHNRKLIIDPVLAWSGYIGGASAETATAIAVDSQGNAYVTGQTQSLTGFPTTNGFQPTHGGGATQTDAFVTKINAAGNAIVYSTYLGGNEIETGQAITVNAAGEAYVAGYTNSTNFPTVNALRPSLGGPLDGFVVKIAANGSALLYSTYVGGSGTDFLYGLAVDSTGAMYVGGYTNSNDLPNIVAGQSLSGPIDGYVMKIASTGAQVAFSSYVGGSSSDYIFGLALDPALNIYVTGRTNSSDMPQAGSFQAGLGGNDDAFVCKLNSSGARVYWTYMGGLQNDVGRGIAVDTTGAAYVAGDTNSSNFPVTAGAFQSNTGGASDAFVAKLDPTGTAFAFSTYLGGNNSDIAYSIAINAAGNVYVTGQTLSPNFPVVSSVKATDSTALDAFVAKFNAAGNKLVYSTLAGGSSTDQANGLAVDSQGSAYITGLTTSSNIVSTIPGGSLNGTQDAFFIKFSDCSVTLAPTAALVGAVGGSAGFSVQAPGNCAWSAFTTDSFIQLTSATGVGNGTVNYTVVANSGAARTGSINVENASFAINQAAAASPSTAPFNVSVSPSSGSGISSTFIARYGTATTNGAPIEATYLLINSTVDGAGACFVEYNNVSNRFRLINDTGNGWLAPLTPGTSATSSNSQCTLSAAGASGTTSTVSNSTMLDVTIPLTFASSFAGTKNVYLFAAASSTNSGWEAKGAWTIPAPAGGVGVGTITPRNSSGTSGTFTGTFTHTGGANQHYLGYMLFLPTPNVVNYTATGTCLVEYNRISNGMRLIDNAGTGWRDRWSAYLSARRARCYRTISVRSTCNQRLP